MMNQGANDEFRLRAMQRTDLVQVHALEERIFPTPWSKKSYQFELERNSVSEQWVIETGHEEDSEIVAYTVCWKLGDEIHIANLAVAPEFRRLGLAKRLLTHVLFRAGTEGLHSATLEVRAGNLAAQSLYESFGFRMVGRRKKYYRDNNEDALLMQLPHLEPMEILIEELVEEN
jgi:[ribosomal protein S18]-alanine N-acetyltransferase